MQTPCSRSPCGGGGASHNAINLTFNAAQMQLSALCRSAAATPQICVMCTKENVWVLSSQLSSKNKNIIILLISYM